jgi:beta-lactamase class A
MFRRTTYVKLEELLILSSMNNILIRSLVSFFLVVNIQIPACSQTDLRSDIIQLMKSIEGKVGVGVMHLETGDTLSINGNSHFPMQSVYKFHQALAVLHEVDEGRLSLETKVLIDKNDYIPNTWSPIATKYPQGNVELSIKDLISYTVASSDNNGCDVLFQRLGGPAEVNAYIVKIGIDEIAIKNTEREMHENWDAQFANWTTPRAMAKLLAIFYKGNVLSSNSTAVLKEIMEGTITGKNRIKGLLPQGTPVGHKTGMGGKGKIISAVNDVGVMKLPNGEHVSIALFITKTTESVETLEKLMAQISKRIFDYYSNGKG